MRSNRCVRARWELNDQAVHRWHHKLTDAPIDLLYLDNTYCRPGCELSCLQLLCAPVNMAFYDAVFNCCWRDDRHDLPTRLDAAQQLHKLLLAHPHHDVVLGVDTLGKGKLHEKRRTTHEAHVARDRFASRCATPVPYCAHAVAHLRKEI